MDGDQVMPPLVSVRGTPEECGHAYGLATAEATHANLAAYWRRFRDEAGWDEPELQAAGAAFEVATTAGWPRIAQMVTGLAAGAGVPARHLYALNARTELLADAPGSSTVGCTAIGVLGTHTADGHLLLGQNWDWHPDQRHRMVLLRTTDEHGHTVLTLTEAGMLAKIGLNSAGVGQCLTLLSCDRDGLRSGRPHGIPYHLLARATLEARSLAHATRAACRSPRNASLSLLLGQAGGRSTDSELINLELVPGAAGWLHPVNGVITHANQLETALPVHDRQQDSGGSSLFRAARARRLLAPAAANGQTRPADLASVFCDHASFPLSICSHLDQELPAPDWSETIFSVLIDLTDRRFGLAPGPPCAHDYRWYEDHPGTGHRGFMPRWPGVDHT
jgi:isopenicillin-N N-acyltransferase-like protein